ncbi:major facilitator superfamily domain-containing protein [Aspergillus heterothallicus]
MNSDRAQEIGPRVNLDFDLEQARRATEQEHALSLTNAMRTYRKSVGWSMLFSLAIIMEGYDTTLLPSFFAFPTFARKYGSPVYNEAGGITSYELSAAWQSGLSNGAYVGEIFGLFLTGLLSERLGYRRIMAGATLSLAGFILVLFFAPDLPTLLIGEILCVIPWGVFQTVTTAYAAEICPVALRGVPDHVCKSLLGDWAVHRDRGASGFLASRGWVELSDSVRVAVGVASYDPISVIVGPESPWWLVRRGKVDEASEVLNRLRYTSKTTTIPAVAKRAETELDSTLALMVYTSERKKRLSAIQSSYTFLYCFRSTDLRRTEITCITWAIQALCGSSFMDVSQSFNMSLGQYGFGVVGTIFSWVVMSRFGRRSLYVSGLAALIVILFAVGFASLSDATAASWAIGSLLLVFTFAYDCTIGPVCYSIVAEIPWTQMRAKTIVLARNFYNMFIIMNGVIVPRMLNPTAWDWKRKTGFFWAGITVVLLMWSYFRLPETKGETFTEMDILFEKKVSARRFRHTEVCLRDVRRVTD